MMMFVVIPLKFEPGSFRLILPESALKENWAVLPHILNETTSLPARGWFCYLNTTWSSRKNGMVRNLSILLFHDKRQIQCVILQITGTDRTISLRIPQFQDALLKKRESSGKKTVLSIGGIPMDRRAHTRLE